MLRRLPIKRALIFAAALLTACTGQGRPDPDAAADPVEARVEAKELPVPGVAATEGGSDRSPTGPVVAAGPDAVVKGQAILRTSAGYPEPKVRPKKIGAVEVEPKDPPGPGCLRIVKDDKVFAIPLQHTDVDTRVTGTIAETTVTQLFVNPYDEAIEAVYTFPLPHKAAVDDYWFHVGKRHIHGVMKEKEEARKIYEEAKKQGKSTALLEQQRPNVFSQSVANIPPGESILIEMHMAHPLEQVSGQYTYAFPTVVGPRFLTGPGATAPSAEDAKLNPPLLPKGTRSGHDIAIKVEIDAGLPVADLKSKSHRLATTALAKGATAELASDDTIPNKDFELSWSLAQDETEAWLMVQRQQGGGYFTLTVQPPKSFAAETARGRELVFVVDNSGSMNGAPLDAAKGAMVKVLESMRPDDRFAVLRFSESASALGPKLLDATPANRHKAVEYTRAMVGMGGTAMIEGVNAALSFPHDDRKMRLVLFMTDGYVSNDQEIFGTLGKLIGDTRLFSMGVGNSVNRHLLEGMALTGRGAVTYIRTDEKPEDAVERFYARIANPVLTDVQVDWGTLPVRDVVPAAIPDLFTGQPVVVYGKFDGEPKGQAKVTGKIGDKDVEILVDVNFSETKGRSVGLASLWARQRIDDLKLPTYVMKPDDDRREGVKKQIIELALAHSVMTEYTSFVAVDEKRVVNPDGTFKTVSVPIEVPEGVTPQAGRGVGLGGFGLVGHGGGGGGTGSGYGRGAGFGGRGKRVPRIRQAKATVTGSLDKDVVRRVVRRHINEVRHCYTQQLTKDPALSGRVEVEFVVSADGKVTSAKVTHTTIKDEALGKCIATAVRGWSFPKPDGGGTVSVKYPFVLSPG